MSANLQAAVAPALLLERSRVTTATASLPFAAWVGFYLSFRLFFPLLAVRVFNLEADTGVELSLAFDYLFLLLALFQAAGPGACTMRFVFRLPCYRWIAVFFGFTGLSLTWSVTASLPAAIAFWCAMAADALTVILLVRSYSTDAVANSLFRGYVWGSCLIAVVAWLMPTEYDLRLGDADLLGPNQIGWSCAFAFFLAQYLARKRAGNWTMPLLLLGITLLRCLSKTTILAFVAGQAFILLRDHSLSRKTKLAILVSALLIVVVFSSLLASYYAVYANAGNQAETLTGRLGIWVYILNEAMQKPWIGHGFHSVWKVIPPFGDFEARHAHNELLQQFYAYGMVGVFMLFVIYGSVWRQLRRLSDSPLRIFFLGMLLFALVRGFADTEVFDLSLPMWLIAIIGALIQTSRERAGEVAR